MSNLQLPPRLPVPQDDGACDHLSAHPALSSVSLASTNQSNVDLSALAGLTLVFCYPRTAQANEEIPDSWNNIPGARGCTPQACSFRDNLPELKRLGVNNLFGLSTQPTNEQAEVHERLHLAYPLLSDSHLEFVRSLSLPVFDWNGMTLVKRITLAIRDGKVIHHWYPIFPSHKNVDFVLDWLRENPIAGKI
ncbi:hypothetical protein N7466_002848 [Penicillium verhagenii]|uniref:uncharacterized protein n=1 Tax=Penicillium verhagenii TaxID=1562060 RepID=UPI002545B695|nr:uncharacterized protein N7466_002848 [Penicillium verhagenii]KAJ5939714.1 hypothetical protein N7466_002848 [Penicillium verhagenii]